MNGKDSDMMAMALDQARRAAARGEVPVGAVLAAADGRVLAVEVSRGGLWQIDLLEIP